jgi:hypothetical protein
MYKLQSRLSGGFFRLRANSRTEPKAGCSQDSLPHDYQDCSQQTILLILQVRLKSVPQGLK